MAKKIKIGVKLTSERLPKNFFSAFRRDVLLLANKTTRKFAKEAEKEAKAIIRKQKFNWKPLKEGYRKAKIKARLDPRILMATKEFVNKGIGRWEHKGFIFVGPKPGIHTPSGLTYQHIARVFEFGTQTMPARPLWRPLLAILLLRRKTYRKLYYEGVRLAAKRLARMEKKEKKT